MSGGGVLVQLSPVLARARKVSNEVTSLPWWSYPMIAGVTRQIVTGSNFITALVSPVRGEGRWWNLFQGFPIAVVHIKVSLPLKQKARALIRNVLQLAGVSYALDAEDAGLVQRIQGFILQYNPGAAAQLDYTDMEEFAALHTQHLPLSYMSALSSSLLVEAVLYPLRTCTTLMMTTRSVRRIGDGLQVIQDFVHEYGWQGLYRGLVPHLMSSAIHTSISFAAGIFFIECCKSCWYKFGATAPSPTKGIGTLFPNMGLVKKAVISGGLAMALFTSAVIASHPSEALSVKQRVGSAVVTPLFIGLLPRLFFAGAIAEGF